MAMVTETASRKRVFSMQQQYEKSPFFPLTPFGLANGSKTMEPFQKRLRTLPPKPGTTFKWEPDPELIPKQLPFAKDLAIRTPLPAAWQSHQLQGSSTHLATPPAVKATRNDYQRMRELGIKRNMWRSKLEHSTGLAEDALDRVGRPATELKVTLGPSESYRDKYYKLQREYDDLKHVIQVVDYCVPLYPSGRPTLFLREDKRRGGSNLYEVNRRKHGYQTINSPTLSDMNRRGSNPDELDDFRRALQAKNSPDWDNIKRRGSNLQQGPRNLYNLQGDAAGVLQNGGNWTPLSKGSQNGDALTTPAYKEVQTDKPRVLGESYLDTLEATPDSLNSEQAAAPTTNTKEGSETKETWRMLYDKAQDPKEKARREAREKDIEAVEQNLRQLKLRREEDEERREKERLATKPEEVSEAFTPLSSEAEDAVDDALHNGNRSEILVLHNETNIEVTRAIMQCLLPGAWLNDEVINVYMQLLKEREVREPDKFLKCHFFNTFFYNKLFKDKRSYDYKSVRRWTTQKKIGYSLADCDKILVPIHQDIHWCLAVINVREKRFEYLDSLKGQDKNVLQVLAKYIVDEVKDKSNKVLDVSKWECAFPDEIPDQLNGCDCGMFMVKYADFHSRGVPLSFTQEHMEYFRRRTVYEILQLEAT